MKSGTKGAFAGGTKYAFRGPDLLYMPGRGFRLRDDVSAKSQLAVVERHLGLLEEARNEKEAIMGRDRSRR